MHDGPPRSRGGPFLILRNLACYGRGTAVRVEVGRALRVSSDVALRCELP